MPKETLSPRRRPRGGFARAETALVLIVGALAFLSHAKEEPKGASAASPAKAAPRKFDRKPASELQFAHAQTAEEKRLQTSLQTLLSSARKRRLVESGVILVIKDGAVVAQASTRESGLDSVFDLASLTKPVATSSAVALLVDRGYLSLSDTVVSRFPEFARCAGESKREIRLKDGSRVNACELKKRITIEQLLRHRTGLSDPQLKRWKTVKGRKILVEDLKGDAAMKRIVEQEPWSEPGTGFAYRDANFVVLAEVVKRVLREQGLADDLDSFLKQEVFSPLGMSSTGYKLSEDSLKKVKPSQRYLAPGVVNDPTARALGCETGNAGLYSNAEDLAKFSQMLLDHGKVGDLFLFPPTQIDAFTQKQSDPVRGLGWDINSEFAESFTKVFKGGFGHTGWTGTSMWFVPEQRLALIILSNRSYYDVQGSLKSMKLFRENVARSVKNNLHLK